MKIASRLIVAALAGIFVVNFATQVLAQESARDTAIHRCIVQAQREYPDATNEAAQRNRTTAYKACMTSAGQTP